MQFLTENRAATPMKRIKRGSEYSELGVQLKDNSVDEIKNFLMVMNDNLH